MNDIKELPKYQPPPEPTELNLLKAMAEAGYWRAECFKHRLELARQTRGMMRMAKRLKRADAELEDYRRYVDREAGNM